MISEWLKQTQSAIAIDIAIAIDVAIAIDSVGLLAELLMWRVHLLDLHSCYCILKT